MEVHIPLRCYEVEASWHFLFSCISSRRSAWNPDFWSPCMYHYICPGIITPNILLLISQGPSLSTLLYSADRTRLTSSTVILQPTNLVCSYFGCYEGCFGFCHYTFSEVSCTAQDIGMTTSVWVYSALPLA